MGDPVAEALVQWRVELDHAKEVIAYWEAPRLARQVVYCSSLVTLRRRETCLQLCQKFCFCLPACAWAGKSVRTSSPPFAQDRRHVARQQRQG